jgi:hypothetical protein
VVGGGSNKATQPAATVCGGNHNEASGLGTAITGGANNVMPPPSLTAFLRLSPPFSAFLRLSPPFSAFLRLSPPFSAFLRNDVDCESDESGFGWEMRSIPLTRSYQSYTYTAKVWALSIVLRPFSVAPCQTLLFHC